MKILWPGKDYAQAGGADPGPDHEGPVEDDVQPRLGRDLTHHAQAERHRGDGLNNGSILDGNSDKVDWVQINIIFKMDMITIIHCIQSLK